MAIKQFKEEAFYFKNLQKGEFFDNKFIKNQAKHYKIINNYINQGSGKGGVFYFNSGLESQFIIKRNRYLNNSADIGSISFKSKINHLIIEKNYHNLRTNLPYFYGINVKSGIKTQLGFLIKKNEWTQSKIWVSNRKNVQILINRNNFYKNCIFEFIPKNLLGLIDTTETKMYFRELIILEMNGKDSIVVPLNLENKNFYPFKKFSFKFSLENEVICLKREIIIRKVPFLNSCKYLIKFKKNNKKFYDFELKSQFCDYGSIIKKFINIDKTEQYKCVECEKGFFLFFFYLYNL